MRLAVKYRGVESLPGRKVSRERADAKAPRRIRLKKLLFRNRLNAKTQKLQRTRLAVNPIRPSTIFRFGIDCISFQILRFCTQKSFRPRVKAVAEICLGVTDSWGVR